MKISINNLGVLKKSTLELGDLTLICGHNNTGKTYATYALYGFLHTWHRFVKVHVSNKHISEIINKGATQIDLSQHANSANQILLKGCEEYTKQLSRIFASNSKYFQDTLFHVQLKPDLESVMSVVFERKLRSEKGEFVLFSKPKAERILQISLLTDIDKIHIPIRIIKDAINEILFDRYLPHPFIVSSERTGVAIFSKELNFARNRLLEEMARADKEIDPMELLFKSYNDYALPVKMSVDFTRRAEDIIKENSFIAIEHPQILNEFSNIIGGEYISGSNSSTYFRPKNKRFKFTMGESSSAVRSMLDIGSYLRHMAKPGDLLMVDEPELNLHPENQRRIARLFVRLIKLGIRVFITTHSDYIIKELNILIMLNQDKPYLRQIAKREGYRPDELLDPNHVNVYMAKTDLIKAKSSSKRRSRHMTLVKAKINHEYGINASCFDETIDKMNEIQDAIIWGN